jgi:hypothetical protein
MTDFKAGDRIRLVFTDDPHTKLEPGDTGTVISISKPTSISHNVINVKWDSGSTLSMIPAAGDRIEKI